METKIINLDNMKTTFLITLGGREYTQKRMTVRQFIDGDILKKVSRIETDKEMSVLEKVESMIDIITANTEIPRDVLLEQDMFTISRIIMILQGIDPTEEEAPDIEKK